MRKAWWILLVCCGPQLAFGQAWVNAKGEGYTSVSYQSLWMRHHLDSFGRAGEGGVRSHVAVMGVNYGLTDRLTVDVDVPYVSSRYRDRKSVV